MIGRFLKASVVGFVRSIPYLAAIPCVPLALLWVLTIPGDPATTSAQLAYWLALWGSLVAYPLVMFFLAVQSGLVRWGKASDSLPRIRRLAWGCFALLIVLHAPLWSDIIREEMRRAEFRANLPEEDRLRDAIWRGDSSQVREMIDAGADVNMRLFRDGSAGQFAAESGHWELVLDLLERGADPDREDMDGRSLRSVVAEAESESDPERARTLASVRATLDARPPDAAH